MKTSKKLYWYALTCFVASWITGVPQLNTFSMVFLTGAMVIRGIREPIEVKGINVATHIHGITSDKTGVPE